MLVLLLAAKPLGTFMAHVYQGERTFLDPALRPVERLLYRLLRVHPEREMTAAVYIACFLAFSLFGMGLLFVLLLCQRWLPGGPDDRQPTLMTPDLVSNGQRWLVRGCVGIVWIGDGIVASWGSRRMR